MKTLIQIKEGDVFHVKWTTAYYQKHGRLDINHCFEGLCIARMVGDNIVLFDTYWGLDGRDPAKWFTLDQVGVDIEVELYCNVGEITPIKDYERHYYKEADVVYLHRQHACHDNCKYFYIRKGASRDKETMMNYVRQKIEKMKNEIEYAQRRMKDFEQELTKVQESANLDEIYL